MSLKNLFLKLCLIFLSIIIANSVIATESLVIEDFKHGKKQKWVAKKKSQIEFKVKPEFGIMAVNLPKKGINWIFCYLKNPVDLKKFRYIVLEIRCLKPGEHSYKLYIQKRTAKNALYTYYTVIRLKDKAFRNIILDTSHLANGSKNGSKGYFVPSKGKELISDGELSRLTITAPENNPDFEIKSIKMLSERPVSKNSTKKIKLEPQPGLVLYYDFNEDNGREIFDKSGNNNNGVVSGCYKRVKGRSGSALQFNGIDTLVKTLDSKNLHITDELTISFWVKPEAFNPIPDRKGSVQTIVSKYWNWRCRINDKNKFRATCIIKVNGKNKDRFIDHSTNRIKLDQWYKFTLVYSVKEKRFSLYINNRKTKEVVNKIVPLRSEAGKPLCLGMDQSKYNPFKGTIDDLYIYNRALSDGEIMASKEKLDKNKLSNWESSVNTLLQKIKMIPFTLIVDKVNKQLGSLKQKISNMKKDSISPDFTEIKKIESSIASLNAVVASLEKGKIKVKNIVIYEVEPVSSIIRVPDSCPQDGRISDSLRVILTPGEYEPASFITCAYKDIMSLKFKISDLISNNGTIPANNIDLRVVKCWYQAGSAWSDIGQDKKKRLLVPELLLHDDSLIKIDYETKDNYIKLDFPQSKKYVWMQEKTNKADNIGRKVKIENPSNKKYYWISSNKDLNTEAPNILLSDFPVKDSPTLLPVNLFENQYKQFWITIKAPEDTKSGIYKGKITLSSQGETLGHINLMVRVLPFKLARARTFYDLNKKFISGIYYKGMLNPEHTGTIGQDFKTREQLEAELKNMAEHGVINGFFYQVKQWRGRKFGLEYHKLVDEQFKLREKAGLENDPMFFRGIGYNLTDNSNKKIPTDKETLNKIRNNAKEIKQISRKYKIKDIYIYGIDEAKGEMLEKQKRLWEIIKNEGVKIVVAGYKGAAAKIGSTLDMHICGFGIFQEEAAIMHKNNNKIMAYANPQAGPENPELFRRNYGLALWKGNYDGASTYIYNSAFGHPWNDFDNPKYRDHNLTYQTVNGVIDTIAWEGYREGIDDIRYATTLKLEIEKAKKSDNMKNRKLALSAEIYLNKLDASKSDLYLNRLEIIKYILQLRK